MPLLVLANGGTTDAHAFTAGMTIAHDSTHLAGAIYESARAMEHEYRKPVAGGSRTLEGVLDRGVILGVNADDLICAKCEAQRLDVEPLATLDGKRIGTTHLLVQGDAVARVALTTRHGRRTVVEYAQRAGPGIVDGAEHARDTRMREGAVADDADDGTLVARGNVGELETMGDRKRGTHVNRGMYGAQRRGRTKRVATNIATHDCLHIAQYREYEAMWAASAQRGWTRGQALARSERLGELDTESALDERRGKLACLG